SGRCKPVWETAHPEWLPQNYPAVIGLVDCGSERRRFGDDFDGIAMGGNSVITRTMLQTVGSYSAQLGRKGSRLLSVEVEDMTDRLLAAGGNGLYLPELVIYHYISPERLTRGYHRR